jgi:glycosyltransferase involved in cell wall biosynthesis
MTKLLFITWDGPQTTYMESLFMPIFQAIVKKDNRYEFHVLQFTWSDKKRIEIIANKAKELGIIYNSCSICRKPMPALGGWFTIIKGIRVIRDYIKQHHINIVMPRATMPAIMVNRILLKNIKLIFDADGLPIEERVDFSGLQRTGFIYRFFKAEETKILMKADAVITRSNKAIDIHIGKIGEQYGNKFFKVTNGRDTDKFKPDLAKRNELRNKLGINLDEKVFVYCGSLGKQYCWDEMQAIFRQYSTHNHDCRFLILTGQANFLEGRADDSIKNKLIVKSVNTGEIPDYLNVADIAFALRLPTYSMQGVAPIKLAEYLLTALPVIASKGIGDTEELLKNMQGCYLYDHTDIERTEKVFKWLISEKTNRMELSSLSQFLFSLEKSADDYLRVIKNLF